MVAVQPNVPKNVRCLDSLLVPPTVELDLGESKDNAVPDSALLHQALAALAQSQHHLLKLAVNVALPTVFLVQNDVAKANP